MRKPVRATRAPHARPVILSGAVVTAAYVSTMARTVTRWDAGEFIAAVHSLGIPHPPGTPLYVIAARVWAMLPLPLHFAARVNLFSAVCGAAAVTLIGLLVRRWTRDGVAGAAATLCAGGTATLWLSATEAEVYAPAFLAAVLLLAIPEWVRGGSHTIWTLLAFAAGLAWTLHPVALVTLPAAVLLAFDRPGTEAPPGRGKLWKFAAPVGAALLGISVVLFLLIRAQHDPPINQGNPVTIGALRDVLMREQYPSYGFWPRQAPLWLQLGNWFEYADWQFALGLSPGAPPSWLRTPITVLFALLGAVGLAAHRRIDRRSWRAMMLAFLAATVGLVLYLNMRLGPSFGGDFLPAGALREARERDYFFTAAFVLWGAWAGLGAVVLARRAGGGPRELEVGGRARRATSWLTAAVIVSAAPLLLNYRYIHAERAAAGWITRTEAVGILESLPADAVFLALGDNDTYPLWYAQVVEGVRPDVAVITVPLLATRWNREEVARRHGFMSLLTAAGTTGAVVAVCNDAAARSRPVFLTPYAPTSRLSAQCPRLQATGTPVNPG
ncbi:MAG TPA: DUF2723 domain-containing protein [Gemmatimonadaceae bacterium]|nr:DUF2723 domain-containing protein [Gemmatimonadaceae bacterium]